MPQTSTPTTAGALYNDANALRRAGRHEEALALYEQALAQQPDMVSAWLNRGNTLHDLARFDQAVQSFDRLLALEPGQVAALHNRANALRELGRHTQACEGFAQALLGSPGHAEIEWNLALAELRLGQFASGWQHYEARWRRQVNQATLRHFAGEAWAGQDCRGKTLLLYSEQGLGDALQCARYLPPVLARGARVVLEVPAPLTTLLRSSAGAAQVVATGAPLPAFDWHCALMSLPRAFGTTLQTLPHDVPYLRVPAQAAKRWGDRLGPKSALRVGLVWAGNPRHENDAQRSMALKTLLEAIDVPAQLVCLQKDLRAQVRATLAGRPDVLFLGEELQDFSDTAALCDLMDVVISVDTSVAHLAGALGRPVWLLLPYVADWRWLLDREDSPWYPSARLFRQDASRDWAPVLRRVAGELRALSLGVSAAWAPAGAPAPSIGSIHVISLARTPQRLASFTEAHGTMPVEVFQAVEGREQAASALVQSGLFDGSVNYAPGAVGCALSHLQLWDRAIATGQPITVCEDDARLHADFPRLAAQFVASLEPGWDFVLWGWNFDSMLLCRLIPGLSACDLRFSQADMRRNGAGYLRSPVEPGAYRLMRAFGIPAYTISAQGARKFRQHVLPIRTMDVHFPGINRTIANTGIDIMMNALYPTVAAHVCFPPLALTDNDHAISTIQTPAG